MGTARAPHGVGRSPFLARAMNLDLGGAGRDGEAAKEARVAAEIGGDAAAVSLALPGGERVAPVHVQVRRKGRGRLRGCEWTMSSLRAAHEAGCCACSCGRA